MTESSPTAFTRLTDHLSLWEVAHRWSGLPSSPDTADRLPAPVKDILFAMMRAQWLSELRVTTPRGTVLKDWSYLSLEEYVPDNPEWDGTEEHRRECYFEKMEQVIKRHDDLIASHEPMLHGEKPLDQRYLESVHVSQMELAKWALRQGLSFPDFWFSPTDKQQITQRVRTEMRYEERIAELSADQAPIPEDLWDLVHSEIEQEAPSNIALPTGRLKEADIDRFWERLSNSQRHRLLCRAMAKSLWEKNPTLTISQIIKEPVIRDLGGASYYSGNDTIASWIRDLDPRPAEAKRGRPRRKTPA